MELRHVERKVVKFAYFIQFSKKIRKIKLMKKIQFLVDFLKNGNLIQLF